MKSALQLELQNLDGTPFIAGIIWASLIVVCLFGIAFVLIRGKAEGRKDQKEIEKSNKRIKAQGF